jgi:hypothetical protein
MPLGTRKSCWMKKIGKPETKNPLTLCIYTVIKVGRFSEIYLGV